MKTDAETQEIKKCLRAVARYLTGPLLIPQANGWEFPARLREVIFTARWRQVMRGKHDATESDLAAEEDALGYLSCVSLAAPLDHDWTEISLYLGLQVFPRWKNLLPDGQSPLEAIGLSQPVELNQLQAEELRRFRRWLREKIEKNARRRPSLEWTPERVQALLVSSAVAQPDVPPPMIEREAVAIEFTDTDEDDEEAAPAKSKRRRKKRETLETIPWDKRDMFPDADETRILQRLAAQPRNHKSGKRAQFLLWYAAGKPRAEILAELKVSEESLRRWYTRWVQDGIDGLLHLDDSSLERLITHVAQSNPEMAGRIRHSVLRVRGLIPDEELNDDEEHDAQEVTMNDTNTIESTELWEIPIKAISPNPDQPRTEFDETTLQELADSIKTHGLIQPISVTPNGSADHFTLLAGERRWRAAQMAGLESILAVVKPKVDDHVRAEIALIENVQRQDLSAAEEARAYQALAEKYGYTDEQIAQRVGKARTTVTNMKRLLALPSEVLEMIGEGDGQISQNVARRLIPLAKLKPAAVIKAAKEIAAEPDNTDRIIEEAINHNAIQMRDLWSPQWPETPTVIAPRTGGERVEVRACEGCPFAMRVGRSWYCAHQTCFDVKAEWFVQEELARVSKATHIPIATPDEKVTPFSVGYSEAARVTVWLKSKPRPDHLRLVPRPARMNDWNTKELLKSPVVVLASTAPDIEKLLAARTKGPKPAPPADESPEQKAKRLAAEEKQRDENRAERSLFRKAKTDVSWLAVHSAQMLAPQMQASGKTLEYLSDFVAQRVRPNGHWVEVEEAIKAISATFDEATPAVKDAENLHRQLILLSLLNEKCSTWDAKHIYQWDQVANTVESLADEFQLKLPAGWDTAPIHHTAANCWVCGQFTANDRLTKRDEEEGWQTAADGTVTCSDDCRAQVKPGKAGKSPVKKAAPKKAAKKPVKKVASR